MRDLLRVWAVAGLSLVVSEVQGQAGRGAQQGIWVKPPISCLQVLVLKAHNRHQCRAAGQEHGTGDDVQEGMSDSYTSDLLLSR